MQRRRTPNVKLLQNRSAGQIPPETNFLPRLSEFISDWTSRYVAKSQQDEDDGPESLPFGADRFAQFAAQFPPAFAEFCHRGERFNVWKVAQLGRDEIRNCRVLAHFLDHSAEHGQGASILRHFLDNIGLCEAAQRAARQQYLTRTEAWPLDDANNHIDIEIEGDDFLLFIEAKIGAPETGDQLRRYIELARSKAVHRDWSVIYLTPNRRAPADPTLSENSRLICASWMDVAEALRSVSGAFPPSSWRLDSQAVA